MKIKMIDLLEESPVIAAVKDDEGIERSFKSECKIIFILYGTVCNIAEIVDRIKEHDKIAIVHADLISGLNSREIVADFIKENTRADGLISTKLGLVKRAISLGMIGGLRTFMIDSMALSMTMKQMETFQPDFLEILPGLMPKILREVKEGIQIPLIASGLLSDKKDMISAFSAGADAISTTREDLWFM
ncbi:glycerol-3-phosphate responsive antiterminator [Lachnospiraceae bacterium 62-35]